MKGSSGGRPVLLGFASARVLSAVSSADVLDERTGRGYQRRISEQHSLDFRRYIQRTGSTTIPLTFNLRPRAGASWRIVEKSTNDAVLEIDISRGPILAQVDCQHRLGHVGDLDVSLPFMILVGLSEREEMEVFSVINSKAKGLSSSLLDFHASRLVADLGAERPELLIALRLHDDPSSPWHQGLDLGGAGTTGMKRRASLRTMQKAVRRFLASAALLEEMSVEEVADAVIQYWQAIKLVLADEWSKPRKHLITKGIGVYSLMGLMADLCADARAQDLSLSSQTFAALLSDFAPQFNWASDGALKGLGGEAGASEALSRLRSARATTLRRLPIGA